MANLLSIAEVAWKQCFPNPGDESKITREEFIATARLEYSYQLWIKLMAEKRENGTVEVPSYLLSEVTLPVKDNEIDISSLKIMRGLDSTDIWLQDVGGVKCSCRYIKSTLNHSKLLCDEDSLDSGDKTFYPVGKKIKFPLGVMDENIPIIYANMGETVPGTIEVDDIVGALVRRSLVEIYSPNRTGAEDKTNNSNSDR